MLATARFTLAVAVTATALAAPADGKDKQQRMSVQVREAQARVAPSFLGRIVFRLPYGAQVAILDASAEPWFQVTPVSQQASGWLHQSALSAKTIVLQAPDKKTAKLIASKRELALAGRSFRDEVERRYRDQARDLAAGYAWLDGPGAASPAFDVSVEDIIRFRDEGGLAPLPGSTR